MNTEALNWDGWERADGGGPDALTLNAERLGLFESEILDAVRETRAFDDWHGPRQYTPEEFLRRLRIVVEHALAKRNHCPQV